MGLGSLAPLPPALGHARRFPFGALPVPDVRPAAIPSCRRLHRRIQMVPASISPRVVAAAQDQPIKTAEIKELFLGCEEFYHDLSAYDMGWIALVPEFCHGEIRPQFPETIKWIIEEQCEDGSWNGGSDLERICSTLSCVVALKSWNQAEDCIQQGLDFINRKLPLHSGKLSDDLALLLFGLLKMAQNLQLRLHHEDLHVQQLYGQGRRVLERISAEMVHEYPTSFVHILEVIHELPQWDKLLAHQSSDGSLFSVPLTACAYIHTHDESCLQYLKRSLKRILKSAYCGSSLLKDLRLVEQLEDVGIDRFFEEEIQQTLRRAFRYWKGIEIGSGTQGHIQNVELAAVLFRVLRREGYQVSSDILDRLTGNLDEGVVPQAIIYDLFVASQFMFPGESGLGKLRSKTRDVLVNQMKLGVVNDKISYSLKFPWYGSMQRVEHIEYITKCPVTSDVAREHMAAILAISKMDFNACQLLYQKELKQILRWDNECRFSLLTFARQKAVLCYFSAAATMFEPELSLARIVWTQMSVLTTVVDDYFDLHNSLDDLKKFCVAVRKWDPLCLEEADEDAKIIFQGLYETVNSTTQHGIVVQARDISSYLRALWDQLVHAWAREAEWRLSKYCPSLEAYMDSGTITFALGPIVMSSIFFLGVRVEDSVLDHPDCKMMFERVSRVGRLLNDIQGFQRESSLGEFSWITIYMKEHPEATTEQAITEMRHIIDVTTKELVEDLLRPRAVPKSCKRVFENILRILNVFYKDCDGFSSDQLKSHVSKLLNEQIL